MAVGPGGVGVTKGRLWCEGFPVVKIAQGIAAKRLTIVYPYYDNPDFLRQQMKNWERWPEDLAKSVRVHVVDDGSPKPAADAIAGMAVPFALRMFRIEQDVRWNWLAARNIGAHHADDGWLLMTDMDHLIPVTTLQRVIYGTHDARKVYAFSRREHTGAAASPHSASFLMTRAMFWKIGGYDEALSGYYGTDGEYRRRVAKHAQIEILTDELIRFEYVGDSSTLRYERKQPIDAAVKGMIAMRPKDWTPKTLSFPYHEVVR